MTLSPIPTSFHVNPATFAEVYAPYFRTEIESQLDAANIDYRPSWTRYADFESTQALLDSSLPLTLFLNAEEVFEEPGKGVFTIAMPLNPGEGFEKYYTRKRQREVSETMFRIYYEVWAAAHWLFEETEKAVKVMLNASLDMETRTAAWVKVNRLNHGIITNITTDEQKAAQLTANVRHAIAIVRADEASAPPATDLPTYRQWSMEKVEDAGKAAIHWLTGGFGRGKDAAHRAAVAMVEAAVLTARQAIMGSATTSALIDATRTQQINTIEGVSVSGAPSFPGKHQSITTATTSVSVTVNLSFVGGYLLLESPEDSDWSQSLLQPAQSPGNQSTTLTFTKKAGVTLEAGYTHGVKVAVRNSTGPARATIYLTIADEEE